jgi:hypothetical protein
MSTLFDVCTASWVFMYVLMYCTYPNQQCRYDSKQRKVATEVYIDEVLTFAEASKRTQVIPLNIRPKLLCIRDTTIVICTFVTDSGKENKVLCAVFASTVMNVVQSLTWQ